MRSILTGLELYLVGFRRTLISAREMNSDMGISCEDLVVSKRNQLDPGHNGIKIWQRWGYNFPKLHILIAKSRNLLNDWFGLNGATHRATNNHMIVISWRLQKFATVKLTHNDSPVPPTAQISWCNLGVRAPVLTIYKMHGTCPNALLMKHNGI